MMTKEAGRETVNQTEVLLKAKNVVNDLLTIISDKSYNNPITAKELRKGCINLIQVIIGSFESDMDEKEIQKKLKGAHRIINRLKWHTCISLESADLNKEQFDTIIRQLLDIEIAIEEPTRTIQ